MNKLICSIAACILYVPMVSSDLPVVNPEAASASWWPIDVHVFDPACTDGDEACWVDSRNASANLTVDKYVPLLPDEIASKHHICVSFPHMKDSYFGGVAYGVISEGRRLGQKITIVEAGGYTNIEKQLNQVEDCIANGADALIIAPISSIGNAKQIDVIRAQGIPVVVIITGVNTAVDAYSIQSFFNMGYISCRWVVDRHSDSSEPVRIVWFPGPPGAGWSVSGDQGCRAAVENSPVEIVETRWGDTGKAVQLELVENLLQTMAPGEDIELDYIVGTAATIEGAVGAIRARRLQDEIKLVAYYYTPGMHLFLNRNAVAMAPSDQMIAQARIAVDQAVRLLEKKPMSTGGRPQYSDSTRTAEHVQPRVIVVTPDNIDQFDTSATLAPSSWRPVFAVD